MKTIFVHPWDIQRRDAEQLQVALRERVCPVDQTGHVRTVAGIDVAFTDGMARAAIVVLSYPALETLEVASAQQPIAFPYLPGLLSFREAPAVVAAAEGLRIEPDLLFIDGQGVAHPRRFGIAAHIGVLFDRPTIGCAKSRLIGEHAPVGVERGAWVHLRDREEVIGAVLRSKLNSKPLYVSIGHRVDLSAAMRYVLATCDGYRLPEPARRAHLAAAGQL